MENWICLDPVERHPLEFFGRWREKANIERCEQFDLCAFAAICCVNRKEVSILINFLAILRRTHPRSPPPMILLLLFLSFLGIVVSFFWLPQLDGKKLQQFSTFEAKPGPGTFSNSAPRLHFGLRTQFSSVGSPGPRLPSPPTLLTKLIANKVSTVCGRLGQSRAFGKGERSTLTLP